MAKKKTSSQPSFLSIGKQYLLGLFVLVSVLTFSILYILEVSAKPFWEAKEQAEAVARQYAGLTSISQVNLYNGQATYYSVMGKDGNHEDVFVLIPEQSSDILVYKATDGVSREQAASIAQEKGADQIDRIVFGYLDKQPIWEVKSGSQYYPVNFETGELVGKEGL